MVTRKPAAKKVATATPARERAPKDLPVASATEVVGLVVVTEKQKLVRDSFTMPKQEYELIDALKGRLLVLSTAAKKSELLRAGIVMLATLSDSELLAALARVPSLKTGRPKKARAETRAARKK